MIQIKNDFLNNDDSGLFFETCFLTLSDKTKFKMKFLAQITGVCKMEKGRNEYKSIITNSKTYTSDHSILKSLKVRSAEHGARMRGGRELFLDFCRVNV